MAERLAPRPAINGPERRRLIEMLSTLPVAVVEERSGRALSTLFKVARAARENGEL